MRPATMSNARYVRQEAVVVANDILEHLLPACERIEIAGSLRREKPDVGDIEILYIPVMRAVPDPADMFALRAVNLADGRIEEWISAGVIEKRRNSIGREMFGPLNKLMRHVASGIPVDLFTATKENWFNYLVCRTGPADSNTRICMAAQRKGWKWNPYGPGFSRACDDGGAHWTESNRMDSEQAVFEFVGLPYRVPRDR